MNSVTKLLHEIIIKKKFSSADRFFEALGLDELTTTGVTDTLQRLLKEQRQRRLVQKETRTDGKLSYQFSGTDQSDAENGRGIVIAHSNNFLFRLSHCCYPLPGDPVVGYITKNQGISIHRINCPKLAHMPQRLVKARWANQNETEGHYLSKLTILSHRQTVFVSVLHLAQVNARHVVSIQDYIKNGRNSISLVIQIENRQRLRKLMTSLRNIKYVYRVARNFS